MTTGGSVVDAAEDQGEAKLASDFPVPDGSALEDHSEADSASEFNDQDDNELGDRLGTVSGSQFDAQDNQFETESASEFTDEDDKALKRSHTELQPAESTLRHGIKFRPGPHRGNLLPSSKPVFADQCGRLSHSAFIHLDRAIRRFISFKLEGDICEQLQERFGGDFRRGEESSSFDSGICLRQRGDGAIIGIELKTGVLYLRLDDHNDGRRELNWVGNILRRVRQRECEVLLVAWPLLPCLASRPGPKPQYLTILRQKQGQLPPGNLRFAFAGNRNLIDPVIPPELWPITRTSYDVFAIIDRLRSEKNYPFEELQPDQIGLENEQSNCSGDISSKATRHSTAPEECSEATIVEILHRCNGSQQIFTKIRGDYRNLVTQKNKTKICDTYLYLIFDRSDERQFTPKELSILLGRSWRSIQARFSCTKHQHIGYNSITDLMNADRTCEQNILHYLTDRCQNAGVEGLGFRPTKYAPYTADFCMTIGTEKKCFVEVKTSQCTILGHDANGGNHIKISHKARHRKKPLHFTYASGRWTWLMTEIRGGEDRFVYGNGKIPCQMLLIHRDDIPSLWWNKDTTEDRWVGYVPKNCLINMQSHDIVKQITNMVRARLDAGITLPILDSLQALSDAELHLIAGTAHFTDNNMTKEIHAPDARLSLRNTETPGTPSPASIMNSARVSPHDGRDAYKRYGDHSSLWALHFLRECRKRQQGLLYPFDLKFQLRRHAFTKHTWTSADVRYTALYPSQNPIHMIQLPVQQKFIYLSFGQMTIPDDAYFGQVHPTQTLKDLRDDAVKYHGGSSRRLLILTGLNTVCDNADSQCPLYAIPTSALFHKNPRQQLRRGGVWQGLVFKDGYSLGQFRVRGYGELIDELIRAMMEADRQELEAIVFRGVKVALVSSEDIFQELRPGYKEEL